MEGIKQTCETNNEINSVQKKKRFSLSSNKVQEDMAVETTAKVILRKRYLRAGGETWRWEL